MVKTAQSLFAIILSFVLVLGFVPCSYADSPSKEGKAQSNTTELQSDTISSGGNTASFGKQQNQGSSNSFPSSQNNNYQSGNSKENDAGTKAPVAKESPTQGASSESTQSGDPGEVSTEQIANDPLQQASTLDLAKDEAAVLPDGDYVVVSALATKQVLDVKSGSKNDAANVQLYASNMTGAQKWRVSHDEDGYVTFTNLGSGKVLDVAGAKTANKTNVQQYAPNSTLAQKWIVSQESDGTYKITSALKQDMVLDVNGASSKNGANVQIYQSNNTNAQRFSFASLNPQVQASDSVDLGDGYYEISSKIDKSFVLDINGASLKNGANAQLYKRNGTTAQLFKFVPVGGFYRIVAASGSVLDAAAANVVAGTNVQQYAQNGTDAQLWALRENSDGSYSFVNKANNLYLDISNGKAQNSQNVQCYTANDTDAQKFYLTKRDTLINEGIYAIQSALDTGKVVDVADGSRSNGANVQLYQNNGTQAQKWQVKKVADKSNVYTMRSVGSGKYLTMDQNGNVCQRDATSNGSQNWQASLSGGRVVLINEQSGKALDVTSAKTANKTNIQGYEPNNTNAQRFIFAATGVLNNGTYVIRSVQNSNQVLDVASGSKNSGANVQSYAWNKSGAQKWKITSNGDGTFTIANAQSGKVLDVAGAKAADKTNVQQYNKNSTQAQKWKLINKEDGTFKWVSALDNSLVLSIDGTPSNGRNVCIAKDSDADNQKFFFEATSYTPPPSLPADQLAMLNTINGYDSGTSWLIGVNRATHKVGVFSGSRGNWSLKYYWPCVTGAYGSPTITGSFKTTGYKKMHLSTDWRATWCTQITGGYFFHTILASESELGKSLSHGCIRMAYPSAQWIYNNISGGTRVVIYN